ncbi:hypothetical protein B0H16DRAFT_1484262 [Mycena metata]|uniref:Uncharacterized protein n=1 Tax=Mycena metata TaxID=1033252 RepID=A0AAD7DT57_9AGAR|nr:hypothetical protein B0H16DRAFT_1484262 [Mycena metata]
MQACKKITEIQKVKAKYTGVRFCSIQLKISSSLPPPTRQRAQMAPIRVNRKLKELVHAYNTNAHATIGTLDGPGHNYMLCRRLLLDMEDCRLGIITPAQLEVKSQYKWGETGEGIQERRRGYRKCLQMYEIVWIASYTTPARKLTGTSLIQFPVIFSIFPQRVWYTTSFALTASKSYSPTARAAFDTENGSLYTASEETQRRRWNTCLCDGWGCSAT